MTTVRKRKNSGPGSSAHKLLKVSTFSEAKQKSRTDTAKLLWLFEQSNTATGSAPKKEIMIDVDGDKEMTPSSNEKKPQDSKNQYEVFINHKSFQGISLNKPEVAKNNIQGILALDIDGTLKNKDGFYINENEIKEIIQKAIDNKFLVVAITFRNFETDKMKKPELTATHIINGLNSGISRIYYTNHKRKSIVLNHLRKEYGLRLTQKNQIALLDDQYKAIINCHKKGYISVPMDENFPKKCLHHLRNFVMKKSLLGDKLFESYRDEFLKQNKKNTMNYKPRAPMTNGLNSHLLMRRQ